jgi:hypothetical protein
MRASDPPLEGSLLRVVAYAKWGEPGYHRISAALDPAVLEAAGQFDRAAEILTTGPPPD